MNLGAVHVYRSEKPNDPPTNYGILLHNYLQNKSFK